MNQDRTAERVSTHYLGVYLSVAASIKGCPACHEEGLSPLGEDGGDAYEFMIEVGHPRDFDKVPFLAALCPSCGHIVWFLKDVIAADMEIYGGLGDA